MRQPQLLKSSSNPAFPSSHVGFSKSGGLGWADSSPRAHPCPWWGAGAATNSAPDFGAGDVRSEQSELWPGCFGKETKPLDLHSLELNPKSQFTPEYCVPNQEILPGHSGSRFSTSCDPKSPTLRTPIVQKLFPSASGFVLAQAMLGQTLSYGNSPQMG